MPILPFGNYARDFYGDEHRRWKDSRGRPCIPENLSASAIELAVKMKMGQDLMVFPDDHKLDASGLVGAILVSTFPCRKPN